MSRSWQNIFEYGEPFEPHTIQQLSDLEADVAAALALGGAGGALDPTYGLSRISGNPVAGATSITLDRIPGIITANAGHFVIIDPFTTEAELRQVTSVSANTIGFSALTYAHNSGDQVYFVATTAQGNLIPWTWWGGLTGSATYATQNVTAFNNLMGTSGQLHNNGSDFGIFIDGGTFYVNDQLKPEHSMPMVGVNPLQSAITATNTGNTFPFDTTGSVAIIHPYREGLPVLYEQSGPSGRWFMRNFRVDGANLTNANGILSSPQQPDSTENVRVGNCPGKYGLALHDVQYHHMSNIQFDNCATSLYMWDCAYVRTFNSNVTSPADLTAVKLTNTTNCSFYGALLETVPTGGKIFDVTGTSSSLGFYDIYTSGFTGGSTGDIFYFSCPTQNPFGKCTYFIANARCNQNASTVNFINDVDRGVTFNTFSDTQRDLPIAWASGDLYYFGLPGTNQFRMHGDLQHTGSKIGFNNSTPVAKPSVIGSRGSNAALASLLTALASEGLITDSTTA